MSTTWVLARANQQVFLINGSITHTTKRVYAYPKCKQVFCATSQFKGNLLKQKLLKLQARRNLQWVIQYYFISMFIVLSTGRDMHFVTQYKKKVYYLQWVMHFIIFKKKVYYFVTQYNKKLQKTSLTTRFETQETAVV